MDMDGLLIGFEIRDSTLVTQSDGRWKRTDVVKICDLM